jgi:hypothetical protein
MNFDVREVSHEFVVQALAQTREEAPAAGEDDIAHEDLAHVGVARSERLRDQRWDRAREVWIRYLEASDTTIQHLIRQRQGGREEKGIYSRRGLVSGRRRARRLGNALARNRC